MERLWKINRTLVQKFEDTDYLVPNVEREAVESLASFEARFRSRDQLVRVFKPRPDTVAAQRTPLGVLVYFADVEEEKKYILTGAVKDLETELITRRASAAYFIINGPLFHVARSYLDNIAELHRVVTFQDIELMFNPTRHRRVPKHILLSPAEASQWKETTGLKPSQIPRIYEDDPQAKYLDARSGDLIKVINPSPTAGFFARHVVVVRRLVR